MKPVNPLSLTIQLLIVLIILPFSPLLITRDPGWWQAWVYGGLSLGGFILSRALARRKHPDILRERSNSLQHKNVKPWDKVLAPLQALGSGLIPLVAGLDRLLWHSAEFGPLTELAGLLLLLLGYALGTWALVENRFFSGTVRIQSERGHKVVSSGPYRWVRHPGYAGMLISNLGIPLLLDSWWAFLPVGCVVVVTFIRTSYEDRTLQRELAGYTEYTQRTRKRLVPFIW